MGVYDDLSKLHNQSPTQKFTKNPKVKKRQVYIKKKPSVDQSIDQSTNRPTKRSTDQLTKVDTLGSIVERPRAFYITLKVDRWLNDAVRYLRDKGMHKMDRSVLVNTLLHNPDHYKPKSLNDIRKRLLAHLTNKSLRRGRSTD